MMTLYFTALIFAAAVGIADELRRSWDAVLDFGPRELFR